MKKGILFTAFLAAFLGFVQLAYAAPLMSTNSVAGVYAISDYEGTYSGVMDNITMRGKAYESRAATYSLEGGKLNCNFPQIGSMPGSIAISLAVVVDEETGEITALTGSDAGTLTILGMSFNLSLDDLRDAKITDNGGSKQIEFTLDISGTVLSWINFPASVHFVGTK